MTKHLLILPILIPLATAALLLFLSGKQRLLAVALSLGSSLAVLGCAVTMLLAADGRGLDGVERVYRIGDWPMQVAIVLVLDRLAALMVFLASVLTVANITFALGRWDRLGSFYHPLSHLLLMGLNGAFLTGDLFNLFVFFEVLLAASYGLLLHGSGVKRVVSGLHYIVINLVASLLILVGVSAIFGTTGTLNMAVLADLVPTLSEEKRRLFQAGAAVLGVAFLVKAAAFPLGFWLPRTYDAAIPPVGAMFVIMTKLGVYVLIRLNFLVLGQGAGAGVGLAWLLLMGAATMAFALIGILAARDLGRLGGYNLLLSAGTLMATTSLGSPAVTAGALFYLLISTLGAATLFFIAGLLAAHGTDQFEPEPLIERYDPGDEDIAYEEVNERPLELPAPIGLLGAAFLVCTLLIAGIPPLPGFIAKVAMLLPIVGNSASALPLITNLVAVLLIFSSFVVLFALMRAGMRIWWADPGRVPTSVPAAELAPIGILIAVCLLLTVLVDHPFRLMERTAAEVHAPTEYTARVLGSGVAR